MVQKVKAGEPRFADGVAVPSQVGKSKEDWIGSQFRRIYDEALEESIPNDMLALLDQLDESTGSKKSDNAAGDVPSDQDRETSK